ncbi:multidrug resistance efflux transporter family protein [Echinicola sp. 20G]|uniref:DMT family transporter n=1 Tax=Echinicola sp. 20G TaxID=2781961 RepID=UPI0019110586|nr:multidrug resistance efflux transporter family protein [Echinicola sp. 20G]
MEAYKQSQKGIIWGISASFFLSFTFLINSLIANSGGNWAWTANLRTLFLIPILGVVLFLTKQLLPLAGALKQEFWLFAKWGTIGFGILYTFISIASLYSPGWMVAATFQINIVAGILLAPLIYKDHRRKIPKRSVYLSLLILVGVLVMQLENFENLSSWQNVSISFCLVLVGAIVWPLANRKLMVKLEEKNLQLNATQRVLGMSVGCIPLLLMLALVGYNQSGFPPTSQLEASFYSALFSGFLGGVSFYFATQMVHSQPVSLAAIEATQVLEIVFTLLGEIILLGTSVPGKFGIAGIAIVVAGLALHFVNALKKSKQVESNTIAFFAKTN